MKILLLFVSYARVFLFVHFLIYCNVKIDYLKRLYVRYNLWRHKVVKNQSQFTMPNISRSKDNQTIKFCWLIECNMGNIFFKTIINHTQNVVKKPFPDTFPKNWVYLWIDSLKALYNLFLLYPNLRAI